MHWFKHHTNALDDEFIQDLIHDHGMEGYGIYFGLLEIIAKNWHPHKNPDPIIRINPAVICGMLQIKRKKLEKYVSAFMDKGKFNVEKEAVFWSFCWPKLAEIKDEWSSRYPDESGEYSGVAPERNRERSEVKKDPKKDHKKTNPAIRSILILFCDSYKEKHGVPYAPTWGKHGSLLKSKLRVYTEEQVVGAIPEYLNMTEDFVRKNGWSFGLFMTKLPAILTGGYKSSNPRKQVAEPGKYGDL